MVIAGVQYKAVPSHIDRYRHVLVLCFKCPYLEKLSDSVLDLTDIVRYSHHQDLLICRC